MTKSIDSDWDQDKSIHDQDWDQDWIFLLSTPGVWRNTTPADAHLWLP